MNEMVAEYLKLLLREKCPYSELFLYLFSAFGLNTKRSLRIQSKYGKIWTRITPNVDIYYAVVFEIYGNIFLAVI